MANARLCHSSGLILVSSGIFTHAVKSDDKSASVLAHEIAQAPENHKRESTSTLILASPIPASPIFFLFLLIDVGMPLALSGLVYFLYKRRLQEKEADYLGTLLMVSAGFDPSAAFSYRKKMKNIEDDPRVLQIPEWMNTHPDVVLKVILRPPVGQCTPTALAEPNAVLALIYGF